jgi:hypothetical protein
VKEVRTQWRAHDPELITTVAALRQLMELIEPDGKKQAA